MRGRWRQVVSFLGPLATRFGIGSAECWIGGSTWIFQPSQKVASISYPQAKRQSPDRSQGRRIEPQTRNAKATVTAKTERRNTASAARVERRREPRFPLHFPIEVSGFDLRRRFFTERTLTLEASNSGGNHSAIAVRVLLHSRGEETDTRPMRFEVVRVERTDSGCTLAAIKMPSAQV